MREQVLKQVIPIVEKSVDDVISLLNKRLADAQMLADRLAEDDLRLKAHSEALKTREAENQKKTNEEIIKYNTLSRKLEVEINGVEEEKKKITTLSRETELARKQAEEYLKASKAQQENTLKLEQEAKELKKKYDALLSKLGEDFAKLDKDKKALDERAKVVDLKEAQNHRDASEIHTARQDLSNKVLAFEVYKREVDKIVKHYKLEEQLKDG